MDLTVERRAEAETRLRALDDGNHRLGCVAACPGARAIGCTGFAGNGCAAFVRDVVTRIH